MRKPEPLNDTWTMPTMGQKGDFAGTRQAPDLLGVVSEHRLQRATTDFNPERLPDAQND